MKHRHDTQIGEVGSQEILACYSTVGRHSKTPTCSTSSLIIIEAVMKISKTSNC